MLFNNVNWLYDCRNNQLELGVFFQDKDETLQYFCLLEYDLRRYLNNIRSDKFLPSSGEPLEVFDYGIQGSSICASWPCDTYVEESYASLRSMYVLYLVG